MESLSPRLLLGAALVVVPVVLFAWLVVAGRRRSAWLVNFNAFARSRSAFERHVGHTTITLALAILGSAFFAGLELLGVPVPSYFRYSSTFWMPLVISAIFSILFVGLFDVKTPTISEDWLDWKRDDETKESSG